MTEAPASTASRLPWVIAAVSAALSALLVAVLAAAPAGAQDDDPGSTGGTDSSQARPDKSDADESDASDENDEGDGCDKRRDKRARGVFKHKDSDGQAEKMAELIGIELDALRAELASGKSLAAVAADNGVDPQTLIDAIVTSIEERVTTALESGRIDTAKADEVRSNAEAMAEKIINRERTSEHRGRGHGPQREGIAERIARAVSAASSTAA